jgi:outer membrane protein TolC
MQRYIFKVSNFHGVGMTTGLLFMALSLAGCSDVNVRQETKLKALTAKLDTIGTVQLKEQSKSEPVSIEQATEQLAKNVTEPNEARPTVSITLEEVRAAALTNNLDLKVEMVDPAIAQQMVDVERAKFESVFFGSARYQTAEFALTNDLFFSNTYEAGIQTPLPTGGAIRTSLPLREDDSGVSEAAVSVSFIQSLLRGAGTRVNTQSIRIATYQKGMVDAGTKLSAIRILGNADIAYWLLYAARKELDVRREQYKLAQGQLNHARLKVEARAAPRNEIVRANAGLAGRLEDVINAETAVRDRERELKRIMSRPDLPLDSPTGILTRTEPDPCGLDLDAETLTAAAMENRMEMADLELRLAISDLDVELARNDTLPQLDLDYTFVAAAEARGVGTAFGNVFDEPSHNHSLGLSARIPLGNHAAQARLRRARLERVRDQTDRERWQQLIRREVYASVDELQQNWRRILAAEQGAIATLRDYRVEQQQFQLGQSTSTDVLFAASRLADAQLRRIRAFAEYEIVQVQLAQATGTLLGRGRIQLQPAVLRKD